MKSRISAHLFPASRIVVSRLILSLLFALQIGTNTAAGQQADAPEPMTFVYGNEVWIPGWTFYDGRDWFALNCAGRDCELVPAALKVTASSRRWLLSGRPTSGQTLTFTKTGDSPGEVVAWIRQDPSLQWLSREPVETYHAHGLTPVLQDKKGTYEIVIKTPGGTSEYLAPLIIPRQEEDDDLSHYHEPDTIFLQLTVGEKQQLLSEPLAACTGELQLDYLRWAGDLDQDGKTDYLISFLDHSMGSVKLYLSGFAKEEEIVGLAGTAITHQLAGGCD